MIASLKGELELKGDDYIIVNVQGIGFKVSAPTFVLDEMESPGQKVRLVTYLHVRETELSLYGFKTVDELELFELLMGVSGVGPRVALNAMSSLAAETLRQAIASGDVTSLTRVPGIGKKVAQRLILDLKDKVGVVAVEQESAWGAITAAEAEVMAGLTSLGYSVAEAQDAVRHLPDEKLELEDQLRLALRYLGGGES